MSNPFQGFWDIDGSLRQAFTDFFSVFNAQLSTSAGDVAKSPSQFFGTQYWSPMLDTCKLFIMPVAYTALAICLAFELYNLVQRNPEGIDVEVVSFTLMRFVLPFLIISHTYDLMSAVFAIGAQLIGRLQQHFTFTPQNIQANVDVLMQEASGKDWFGKFGLQTQVQSLQIAMSIIGVLIWVVIAMRIFELSLMWIFSPIPIAFLISSEEKQTATAFLKQFFALLLQGAMMLLCLQFYNILAQAFMHNAATGGGIGSGGNGYWYLVGAGIALLAALLSTGRISKRLLNTF